MSMWKLRSTADLRDAMAAAHIDRSGNIVMTETEVAYAAWRLCWLETMRRQHAANNRITNWREHMREAPDTDNQQTRSAIQLLSRYRKKPMNDLTKYNGGDNDGFEDTANETTGTITGQLLKFKKGTYYVGKGDKEELPLGTQLVALSTTVGWQKWEDGKCVDQRFRVAGERLLTREQLDDEHLIDTDDDPWRLTRFLYLLDPETASDFTFVTSSWGGHDAIRTLSRQIAIRRSNGSGANAIIKLGVGHKQSKDYGSIPAPKLEVVGWTGETARPAPTKAKFGDGFGDELAQHHYMDDEIPF